VIVQELLHVPQSDAIVKAHWNVFKSVICPRQFEIGNVDAVGAQLVAQDVLKAQIHDVIAAGRNH
jgi:hypothetical protein